MIRKVDRIYIINQNEVKEALCLALTAWNVPAPKDYRELALSINEADEFEISWKEEIPPNV